MDGWMDEWNGMDWIGMDWIGWIGWMDGSNQSQVRDQSVPDDGEQDRDYLDGLWPQSQTLFDSESVQQKKDRFHP